MNQIKSSKIYTNKNRLGNSLSYFFEKVLAEFYHELELIGKQWYNYPGNLKGIGGVESINDVFVLSERSYVGIFNNAIIRSFPKDAVLQEFSVNKIYKGKSKRCDYLVKHRHEREATNILFEAKQRRFDGKDYTQKQLKAFLNTLLKQGLKYYKADKPYYEGAKTYVASLVFEWVLKDEYIGKVLGYANDDDGVTDFYCFYHTPHRGLMVYGNVELQNNYRLREKGYIDSFESPVLDTAVSLL